jgi:hypothetical protein
LVGGVKLPLALAALGLIDEYGFVVQPRLAGYAPTLFAGLSKRVDLRLVSRQEFGSGAVGDAVWTERVAIGLVSLSRPHHEVTRARPSKVSTNLTIASVPP